MRLIVPLLAAILLSPIAMGVTVPGPHIVPPAAAPDLPEDPRDALLFAARAAGLDDHRIVALAVPETSSPDAATAYDRLLGLLELDAGSADRPLPELPPRIAAALVPLLDAAADAVRLRTEALAGLDDTDRARLDHLHAAYVTSRMSDDRDPLAVAWADGGLPSGLDRERIVAGAYRLMDAGLRAAPTLGEVAGDWPADPKASGAGLCVDDGIGVLILCGPLDDVLTGNHILEIDLGGNDAHATNAGASGLGVLWQGANGLPAALALDIAGDDGYGGGAQVQGTGSTTPGVLLDLDGNDGYHSSATYFNFAQGAGNLGGVGVLYDATGQDSYTTPGGYATGQPARDTQAFGILGGIGILVDTLGNDVYVGGDYAQGVGDFNAVGLLLDNDGNDHYEAVIRSQAFGDGLGLGMLLDGTGNDYHLLWETLGQGTSIGGAAILLDVSGSDAYVAFEGYAQGLAVEGVAWKPVNDVLQTLGLSAIGTAFAIDLEGTDAWHGSRGCNKCIWLQGTGVGFDAL